MHVVAPMPDLGKAGKKARKKFLRKVAEDKIEAARQATGYKPGTEEKVELLTIRYAMGIPLWHEDDFVPHTNNDKPETYAETKEGDK